MFPMVATVEEFDEAKSLVERELTHLRRHSHKLPERVEVGTMLEVPSLLYQLDELLERVDFLSVGSNDLVQFFYAADRGNSRVADRFDAISAPVLRALKEIADHGRTHAKPVTLCGELASTPIGALALVAIGYRSLRSLRPPWGRSRPCCSISMPQGRGPDPAPDRQSGPQHADPRTPQGIRSRGRAAALMRTPCKPDGAGTQGDGVHDLGALS